MAGRENQFSPMSQGGDFVITTLKDSLYACRLLLSLVPPGAAVRGWAPLLGSLSRGQLASFISLTRSYPGDSQISGSQPQVTGASGVHVAAPADIFGCLDCRAAAGT